MQIKTTQGTTTHLPIRMAKIKHSDNTDAVKVPETWITLAVLGTCKGAGLEKLTDSFSSTEHYRDNRQWNSWAFILDKRRLIST